MKIYRVVLEGEDGIYIETEWQSLAACEDYVEENSHLYGEGQCLQIEQGAFTL